MPDPSTDGVIDIQDLSGGEIAGAGNFDELMRTIKSNIQEEYDAKRITGNEYSQVYLGALTATLQIASQFTLESEKATQQGLLLAAQVEAQNKQIELLTAQIADTAAGTLLKAKELELMEVNRLQTIEQTKLTTSQTAVQTKQLDVMDEGITASQTQQAMVIAQTSGVNATNLNIPKQGIVLDKQATKLDQDTALATQKTVTELAQTKDPEDLVITTDEGDINESGYNMVKTATGGGVAGRNIAVFQRQFDGFLRDAQQKSAKMMIDTWNVRETTETGQPSNTAGLSDAQINNVLNVLKNGIGVPNADDT
mgnify:CR=1 FL=1